MRSHWDEAAEKWFFSIVDTMAILTDSVDPGGYWRKLKERLKKEGNETVTDCHGLKMMAVDGKLRIIDVADTEQLFRLIQSDGFEQSRVIAKQGGTIAGNTRREIEEKTGRKVVSSRNQKSLTTTSPNKKAK